MRRLRSLDGTFCLLLSVAWLVAVRTASAQDRAAQPAPRVVAAHAEGPVPEAVARAILAARQSEVARCSAPATPGRPLPAGQVTLRVLVAADGTAQGATIEQTTLHDESVEQCIVRLALDLRFPARGGSEYATVRYELAFGLSPGPPAALSLGQNFGYGGLGLRGSGTGGGGTGEGMIGLGSIDKMGHGGGSGSPGYGSGSGRFGQASGAPVVRPGAAEVRGSLDRTVIQTVIRRRLNEVRFCYEQSLARRPGLRGQVTVRFTIGAAGAVIAADVGRGTLGDAPAEACIAAAVRRWVFPRPAGGGIVVVTHPFHFGRTRP